MFKLVGYIGAVAYLLFASFSGYEITNFDLLVIIMLLAD